MSSGTGVAAPIARGRAPKGLGPGVRVKRKAQHFGEEWAKQTFGKDWTTALVHGRIVSAVPDRAHEWIVLYDGDPDEYVQTSRHLTVDKNRENARLAALPVTAGGTGGGLEEEPAPGSESQMAPLPAQEEEGDEGEQEEEGEQEAKTMTLADSQFFMSINPKIICTYIKYYWIDILSCISIECESFLT